MTLAPVPIDALPSPALPTPAEAPPAVPEAAGAKAAGAAAAAAEAAAGCAAAGGAVAVGPVELLARLAARYGADDSPVTHVERVPARAGQTEPWPAWVPDELREALVRRGIAAPWRHQVRAAELAWSGRHVVLATGTASGKSLGYQLPALSKLLTNPRATVLYLAPTKALAADQLRAVRELDLPDLWAACYDGDTPREEREWIRQHGRFMLTNPDMLHHALLPGHAAWTTFLRRLRYVVVDECHTYRGVFGSHVAHVLRRLRRLAARAGSEPTFVLASATAGDPASTAGRLTGLPVEAVTEDTSPRAGTTFALWEPPLLPPAPEADGVPADDAAPVRRSALRESADLLADAIVSGVRTLAFVRSRRGAEVVAAMARRSLDEAVLGLGSRVAAYRSGYLREERRSLERRLLNGSLLGLASTNALELGVDLVGLDAVVLCGFPGTRSSLWQQAGRAGRAGREALCVLVARDDPLDTYLVHHPEALFGRPVEATVLDPGNPYVLGPQLCCAASEAPLTEADLALFDTAPPTTEPHPATTATGPHPAATTAEPHPATTHPARAAAGPHPATTAAEPSSASTGAEGVACAGAEASGPPSLARVAVDALVAAGGLRKRPSGWYWTQRGRPEVDLRGGGGAPITLVEAPTGRLLGTVDAGSAHFQVHAGAVYLHQGVSYLVDELDLDDAVALVHAEEPEWSTHARDVTSLSVVCVRSYVDAGAVGLFLGDVDVTGQVVSYQRRKLGTGEVIDTRPLDLPARELRTVAVWFTVSPRALDRAGIPLADVPGALHAAEHAAIGLLPLVATCDRWDIGGLSTANHPDTEAPTVFVYDGHPGGAGFAERAYAVAGDWLAATRAAIADCGCETGCPSCVQSPKCGNGNSPLAKAGAVHLLDAVLAELTAAGPRPGADGTGPGGR